MIDAPLPDRYPLVTAAMAIYNSEATLGRALDSLLAQDYPNLEILICEDRSPDRSWAICQEYAAKDSRIRLIRNQENLGFERNYLQVIREAEGEFCFWADGDDVHHPRFVSVLMQALQGRPDAAVAQGAMDRWYDDGEHLDVKRLPPRHDLGGMGAVRRCRYFLTTNSELRSLKHNYFQMGLWRRACLLPALETYPWKLGERPLLAAVALVHPFVYVDEVLTIVHLHRATALERYPEVQSIQQGKEMDLTAHRLETLRYFYSLPHFSFTVRWLSIPALALVVGLEKKMRRAIRKRLIKS